MQVNRSWLFITGGIIVGLVVIACVFIGLYGSKVAEDNVNPIDSGRTIIRQDLDFLGHNLYTTPPTNSLRDCAQLCHNNPDCHFYTHAGTEDSGICQLKQGDPDPSVTLGFKSAIPGRYTVLEGFSLDENTYSTVNTSDNPVTLEMCQNYCDQDVTCHYINFNSSTGVCKLGAGTNADGVRWGIKV